MGGQNRGWRGKKALEGAMINMENSSIHFLVFAIRPCFLKKLLFDLKYRVKYSDILKL